MYLGRERKEHFMDKTDCEIYCQKMMNKKKKDDE